MTWIAIIYWLCCVVVTLVLSDDTGPSTDRREYTDLLDRVRMLEAYNNATK